MKQRVDSLVILTACSLGAGNIYEIARSTLFDSTAFLDLERVRIH